MKQTTTQRLHSPKDVNKPMNTWEDRFDDMAEELCVWFDSDGEDETNVYLDQLYELDEIKAFIRSELQQQRRDILKIIASFYYTTADGTPIPSCVCEHNKDLDDIIKKVEE